MLKGWVYFFHIFLKRCFLLTLLEYYLFSFHGNRLHNTEVGRLKIFNVILANNANKSIYFIKNVPEVEKLFLMLAYKTSAWISIQEKWSFYNIYRKEVDRSYGVLQILLIVLLFPLCSLWILKYFILTEISNTFWKSYFPFRMRFYELLLKTIFVVVPNRMILQ